MAVDHTRPVAGLRLHALDAEDLPMLSAHVQDALLRVGDIAFLPEKRRFAIALSRFDWAAEADGRLERASAGLHFEGVRAARCLNIDQARKDGLLSLLAVAFEPGPTPPEGRIQLIFAGGATISLEVECIEAQLCDLGPRWPATARPSHHLDEGAMRGS